MDLEVEQIMGERGQSLFDNKLPDKTMTLINKTYSLFQRRRGQVMGFLSFDLPRHSGDVIKAIYKSLESNIKYDQDPEVCWLESERNRFEQTIRNLQIAKNKLESEIGRLGQTLLSVRRDKDRAVEESQVTKRRLGQLEAELREHKYGAKSNSEKALVEKQLQQEKQRIQQLEAALTECTQEKNDALSRLSEAVSLQLRDNNPDIVDLSDCHRPEKLAELSNEIYDNEWLDATEQLNEELGMEEEPCNELLLNIVMDQKAILPVLKQLKDARKGKALDLLSKVEKDCKLHLEQSIQQLAKEQIQSQDQLQVYISACIKLCWLMAVQDPPCVMVCPGMNPKSAQNGQDVQERVRSTSQSFEDSGEENFEMANEPTDDDDQTVGVRPEFDKKYYKEYTQSGQYVQYAVWPCMQVQDNGRILSKGVVQCCNEELGNIFRTDRKA